MLGQDMVAAADAVHHEVAAYGGSFLALVALKYFFDSSKEVHWIRVIEEPLAKWGRVDVIEVGIVLVGLGAYQRFSATVEEKVGHTDKAEEAKEDARRDGD